MNTRDFVLSLADDSCLKEGIILALTELKESSQTQANLRTDSEIFDILPTKIGIRTKVVGALAMSISPSFTVAPLSAEKTQPFHNHPSQLLKSSTSVTLSIC